MSVLSTNQLTINKSSLNHSPTKMMFSFNKAERWEKERFPILNSSIFYNLPDTKSSRYTTLGKGQKYDLAKYKKNSCDSYYDIPSIFNRKKPNGPSYSFGISRDFYDKVYCDSNTQFERNVPGPGKYEIKAKFGEDSPKFSLGSRLEESKFSDFKTKVPPPGEYKNVLGINSTGKYPVSNVKNATNIVFGASKDKRFNYKFSENPSPGNYNHKPLIDGTGKLFISKFTSNPAKSILSRNTSIFPKFTTPGPGSYDSFSEFAQYKK